MHVEIAARTEVKHASFSQNHALKSMSTVPNPEYMKLPRDKRTPEIGKKFPSFKLFKVMDACLSIPRGIPIRFLDAETVIDQRQSCPISLPRIEPDNAHRDLIARALESEQGLIILNRLAELLPFALALLSQIQQRALLILPGQADLEQWRVEVESERLNYLALESSLGKNQQAPLVMSTLRRNMQANYLNKFGLVMVIQPERINAWKLYDFFNKQTARYRFAIGLNTARQDGFEFLIRNIFGELIPHF